MTVTQTQISHFNQKIISGQKDSHRFDITDKLLRSLSVKSFNLV